MLNYRINEQCVEVSICGKFKVRALSQHLAARAEENHKTSGKLVSGLCMMVRSVS
jgi:hypothetical protein